MKIMWNILEYFYRPKSVSSVCSKYKSLSYYSGPELPIADIRARLSQSTGGSVDLEKNEETGIATLYLNHPERRNAISGKMMLDMESALSTLEEWTSGKGLIVRGHGNTFCSGGDLNMARLFSNPHDGFSMATFMHGLMQRLEDLSLISVALIQGTGALGGGSEIAIACDFRLLASNAAGIGFVHTRMGITPAWGGCTRLVRTVGYTKALDLMASGRRVAGDEALRIGLADGIVNSENAVTEAEEWLQARVRADPHVVKALKAMAHNAKVMTCEESLAEERRLFAPLWGGPANQAALCQNIKHK